VKSAGKARRSMADYFTEVVIGEINLETKMHRVWKCNKIDDKTKRTITTIKKEQQKQSPNR